MRKNMHGMEIFMLKKYQLRSYNIRLVIVLLITTMYGIIVINSANSAYTIKQLAGLFLSFAVMLFVSLIDYNFICRYYWLLYLINLILLVLVKFSGSDAGGAQRWFSFLGIRFQPSELSKIILIIFTAKLITIYKDKLNSWKFLAALMALIAVPLFLVLSQPDLSTTIVLALIVFSIVFCAGLKYKIIGYALLIIVPIATGLLIYISNPNQVILKDYQRNRIMAFIYPEKYDAEAYQQEYSVKAIGSGQLTGKGLNNDDPSSLKNANYIAEAQTDFIFAVLGEELGFVGSCLAILLLSWIVLECIIVAVKAKDFTGRLICCGVASYIAFQSFVNLGVVTGLLPNTGLPLPFFSYGLTSLVTLYISMGVVLNISLQRNVYRENEIFAHDFKG